MQRSINVVLTFLLFLTSTSLSALEYEWGDLILKGKTFVTAGAGVRLEERDEDLIFKLNLEGQQDLCTQDDCVSLTGDLGPNQRLVDARGDFSAHLFDDGNMNYDKGDVFTGLVKINSEWEATWGDWKLGLNVVGFYDEVNTNFIEERPNQRYLPASRVRSQEIEDRAGKSIELRSWQVSSFFEVFDQEFSYSIGRQRLRWGESNLTLLNTLDLVNPLDASLARQPGFPIKEAFNPVEVATLATNLTDDISLEMFYQFKWRGTRVEPSGTMYSSFDPISGGNTATITLGQFPEDPNAQYVSNGVIGLFSNSHRTLVLPDEDTHAPRDGGQYGFDLSVYLPNLNYGTDLGFYFANYHSRLPYFSMTAAQESCARNSRNLVDALNDCNGLNSARNQDTAVRCAPGDCDLEAYLAREPLALDTAGAFLEYPEDRKVFGASFNTTLGGWSVSGEYSYRPNMPLQVHFADVYFAGLQPGLPGHSFKVIDAGVLGGVTDINNLLGLLTDPATIVRTLELLSNLVAEGYLGDLLTTMTIPGARQIGPDFINFHYRDKVAKPGEYVQGYEEFDVHQLSLGLLQAFSTNPVGADQILFIFEAGATYVHDLPGHDKGLYLQGSQSFTHPSQGADGTGVPAGEPVTFAFNPTQQTDGFGEDFAWGIRTLVQMDYPNVFDTGLNVKPTLVGFYDVEGIAPFPIQNYVEGNTWLIPGIFLEYGQHLTGSILYQHFSGENNQLRDRDSILMEVTYSF